MANLRIDIASEFTGRRAFQQAESATTSLDKAVNKLGKQLASVFAVSKLAAFSRESIKAFTEDQKAAANLANTLKNLGYSYSTADAENFVQSMQKQTGILDDQLRPAYAQLLQVTGSMTQTQKTMALAFDVASGTGQSYENVINALSQAYVGNNKGLKQLQTGLTQAELKTKSFAEISDILAKKFQGAGATAIETYAGKIALLNVAIANSKEIIGQGFVDAFTQIASDKDFINVTTEIENMATYVADTIRGIGTLLDTVSAKTPSWLKTLLGNKAVQTALYPVKGLTDQLAKLGAKKPLGMASTLDEYYNTQKINQRKKAEADAAARARALADAIKKQTAAQNELIKKKKEAAALDALSLKYKQAEAIFDMEKIQLAAASMSKQTAEDYARIKLKQDLIALQEAIQAGDLKTAEALSKVVAEDYKRVWAYQAQNIALGIQNGTIQNIQNAVKLIPTDLNVINLDNLNEALAAINAIIAALSAIKIPTIGGTTAPTSPKGTIPNIGTKDYGGNVIGSEVSKSIADMYNSLFAANDSPITGGIINSKILSNLSAIGGIPTMSPNAYGPQGVTITVVDNTSGLIDVITNATQQGSANGINTRILRNTGNLSW